MSSRELRPTTDLRSSDLPSVEIYGPYSQFTPTLFSLYISLRPFHSPNPSWWIAPSGFNRNARSTSDMLSSFLFVSCCFISLIIPQTLDFMLFSLFFFCMSFFSWIFPTSIRESTLLAKKTYVAFSSMLVPKLKRWLGNLIPVSN